MKKISSDDGYETILACCPGEKEVSVYYWHAVDSGEGERKPGEVYVQVVEIDY